LGTGAEGKKSRPAAAGRVLSGMRPTGRLHIGHYFGALQNWVRLQDSVTEKGPAYECFYFIADWHALTSDYADTSAVAENTLQIMIDYLAAGLDPAKSVIFQQSAVPEHAELHLLLSMVTPLGWLERVPTYKEALENVKDKDLHNYGFLGYPILQCADIVIYSKEGAPLYVPVGEDQVSHVELSREIVHKFNFHTGVEIDVEALAAEKYRKAAGAVYLRMPSSPEQTKSPVGGGVFPNSFSRDDAQRMAAFLMRWASEVGLENFREIVARDQALKQFVRFREYGVLEEPQVMLTKTPRIPGLDGRKMSKSYGNAITLSETDEEIRAKTKVMVTDPARKRRTDPGNPDVCPVYDWHKLFSTAETLQWAAEGCRSAGIGCIECKAKMADHLIEWIAPVRARRVEYEKNPKRVLEILDAGSKKARVVAQETMERVREAVLGWGKKRKEIGGATAKE
jgi:tryptophanyl-tRNA synthetase